METVPEENLTRLFDVIGAANGVVERDVDGNECMALEEFLDFAGAFLSDKELAEEVDELFDLMDTSDEFASDTPQAGHHSHGHAVDESVEVSGADNAALDESHGDGTINAEEFRRFFHKYGQAAGLNISDNDLDDIMREIDSDNQGTISKEELLEFLEKLQH